jgi:nucleoside-diphosphate-sugar epimerase
MTVSAPRLTTTPRTVVTGASGFVGRALVRRLAAHGHEVVAMSRHGWNAPAGARQVIVSRYDDEVATAAALEGAQALVHLAALAHRRGDADAFAVNEAVTSALVRASAQAGIARFVFVSSIGVNGHATHGRPFTEANPPAPAEPYALSKLRSEQAVVAGLAGVAGTSYTLIRPPLVYGPRAPGNFGKLVRAVQRGWPLPFAGARNARSLIGLDNLLGLIETCLDHPAAANELFLAADGEDVSTRQIVEHIAQGLGRPPRLWHAPAGLLRFVAGALGRGRSVESLFGDLQVDAGKARARLGWVPAVRVAQGLQQAARESVAA